MKRWMLVAWALSGCTSKADKPAVIAETTPAAQARPKVEVRTMKTLGSQGALEEGAVSWEGMVVPTKGGYRVRGVTIDGGLLPEKLAASSVDVLPAEREWFVGAMVRVSGELKRASHDGGQPGEPRVQSRVGEWFEAARVDGVELVARAVVIEGRVGRSKGLATVGDYLLDRHELERALMGQAKLESASVRVWGQPRVYQCRPDEQCLITGSIPMFDVARAQLLP